MTGTAHFEIRPSFLIRGVLRSYEQFDQVLCTMLLVTLAGPAGAASGDGKEWSTPGLLFVSGAAALLVAGLLFAFGHAMAGRGRSTSGVRRELQGSDVSDEGRMRGIFNSAQESIVIIDEQGVLEDVSPSTAQMLGYRIDELVGRPLTMLMDVADDARENGSLERYLKTGRPGVIANIRELSARRHDGTTFPVELGLVEQHIEGRRRFVGTVRDLTQTKLTHALLRAETRIATVVSRAHSVDEVAADIVAALCGLGFEYGQWIVCTPITREWQVSARHLSRTLSAEHTDHLGVGVAGPDAQGTAMRAWVSSQVIWCTHLENNPHNPRAAAAVGSGLRSYAVLPVRSAGEAVAVIELFSASADPRSPTLDSALSNIALQVGQLVSRLQAEQQLHTIIRTVPSAVFQARQGERRTIALSFISAKIESLWGVPPEGALAHPRRALWKVPRAYRRKLLQGLSEAITQREGWDVTVPVKIDQSHNHDVRWLRIHAAPGHEYGDAPVWDGIISDVTEQKLAEQQVVLLNLDLERRVEERTHELAGLNTELEAFADAVSHDLRAPLRGMSGYAQMLQARASELPDEMGSLVEKILAQGEHMEQLIAALLELSRISRHELRKIGTDLSEIATQTLEELRSRDPQRVLRWSVTPGMRAYADPRLLRIIFDNLLGNAWKFTRDQQDPAIEVGTMAGETCTFFVRDNGAGFDPQYANKLFQPFQRLHPTSQFEGTGIGLATVQRIVRRHGGRIWSESTPQHGATFFFELPAQQRAHSGRGT